MAEYGLRSQAPGGILPIIQERRGTSGRVNQRRLHHPIQLHCADSCPAPEALRRGCLVRDDASGHFARAHARRGSVSAQPRPADQNQQPGPGEDNYDQCNNIPSADLGTPCHRHAGLLPRLPA